MPFICSVYNNFANKGIGYESGKCKGVVLPEKERGGCRRELSRNGKVECRKIFRSGIQCENKSPAIPLVFGTRFREKRGGKGNQQPAG